MSTFFTTNLYDLVRQIKLDGTPKKIEINSDRVEVTLNTGSELVFDTTGVPEEKAPVFEPVLKQAFKGARIVDNRG